MITIYLILVDLIIPLLFTLPVSLFLSDETHNLIQHFMLFISYGLTVVSVSFIFNFYKNYYSINYSEKLRISFITSFITIFFQLCIYLYLELSLTPIIIFFWILIPIIILITRYFIKIFIKSIKLENIYIVGNLYRFNDSEIKMLTEKGFTINFFDSLDFLKNDLNQDNEFLIVQNFNKNNYSLELSQIKFQINLISLKNFMKTYLRKIYIDDIDFILDIKSYKKINYFLKRIIDYFSVFILFPMLILSSLIMIILKKYHHINDSLIYKQKRYGINKTIFTILKIRTMNMNTENLGNTKKNDNRIYIFAKWLRKYRFDELPQIINIIFGHMHLVGPRAEWVKLSDEYNLSVKNYYIRHIVKPGITGWAQIVYPYGLSDYDAKQKLMYELYYIKEWSIWLELEICFKTFLVILDKKGI